MPQAFGHVTACCPDHKTFRPNPVGAAVAIAPHSNILAAAGVWLDKDYLCSHDFWVTVWVVALIIVNPHNIVLFPFVELNIKNLI